MMNPCTESLKLKAHIFGAFIGFAGGLVGFLIFCFHYNNNDAGIWSLMAGIMALLCLQFHIFFSYNTMEKLYSPRSFLYHKLLGIVGAVCSIIAMVIYIALAIKYHVSILPVPESYILPAVQALLTFKWSIAVAYFAKKYSYILEEQYTLF